MNCWQEVAMAEMAEMAEMADETKKTKASKLSMANFCSFSRTLSKANMAFLQPVKGKRYTNKHVLQECI